MASYEYDNPDDAYREAQRRILSATDELYLLNLGLIDLPPEIFRLTSLKVLDVSDNLLTTLPPNINYLTNLKILRIHNNRLSDIPTELTQLTNLEVLDLGMNQIRELPPGFFKMAKLRTLFLYGNRLEKIHPEIAQLAKLETLSLHGNPALSIPTEVVDRADKPKAILGYLKALRRIKLAKKNTLFMLDLSNLGLTAIPPEIGQLDELKMLDLSMNELMNLTPEIKKLTSLKELFLYSNSIHSFPLEILHLKKLNRLNIYGNLLSTIPLEFWQLTEMTSLHLSGNQLTTISPKIRELSKLTYLSLRDNHLVAIPSEIGYLTELKNLKLYNNKLETLPFEITQLTNLEKLDLRENPDLRIPPEIVAKWNNAQDILNYLRQQQIDIARPLNEAKLVLVGQGSVGKTSIVKRLLGQEFDEAENQTEGINIESWSLDANRPKPGVVPIALNIWDFGGQEIMHATHQFFLTKRSLYLLVLDARQGEDEGRVEYWLALINSFAPDAPVLIVINKSDQHHLDINRRGLQEKYPAIKGFIRTSARSGQGIEQLKTEIAALLATMEHVDTAFPASWMRVKTDLVTMQAERHFLPYDEYEDICRQHGIAEESSQTTLVRFLHDLGIVLNFTDDDRVRDTSVLNPNWVTGGIYALLNSEQLQQKQGILVRNQVRDLLSHADYPSQQRRFLLDMMTKFELAFGLPGGQTLLIPDLISKEQPAFEWDDANALQFAYQYSVLPRSILHRFMVRQHQRVDPEIRWRTGVMLHHDGFTALVKADIKAATIRISITGDGDRRQFLYSLRLEFAGIHDTIQGTKPREVVPIPGHPDAQPIDYAYLEQLEKMKMDAIPYPAKNGEVIMLDVQALLNGVSTSEMRQAGLPTRREVLSALNAGFDKGEFHGLLFELGIGKNDIGGESTAEQMRECVEFAERNNKYQDLVTVIASKRPHLFNESRRL